MSIAQAAVDGLWQCLPPAQLRPIPAIPVLPYLHPLLHIRVKSPLALLSVCASGIVPPPTGGSSRPDFWCTISRPPRHMRPRLRSAAFASGNSINADRGVLLSCSNSPLPFCAASAHQLFLARHIKPIPNSVTDALGSPPAARRPEPAPPHRPSPAVALLLTGSGVYLSYRPRPPVKRRGRPPTTLFRPCSEGLTSLQWLTCSFEHVPC